MTTPLDQQIERQRQRVAATQEFAAPTVDRPRRADALNAAMAAHRQQQAVLDDLIGRRNARCAAIAAHAQATQDRADELIMLREELEDQRRALGERVSAAIDALGAAFDAAQRFDDLLADRSKQLRDAGLPASYKLGSAEQVTFQDGGGQGGSFHPHLIVGDHAWQPVYPAVVVSFVEHAVVAGRRYLRPQRFGALSDLLDPVVRRPAPVPPPAPEAPKQSRLQAWAQ